MISEVFSDLMPLLAVINRMTSFVCVFQNRYKPLLKNDCVMMFGEKVKLLHTSKGGHYCISLNKKVDVKYGVDESVRVYVVDIKKIKELPSAEKKKVAMKVHKQFCHCSGNEEKNCSNGQQKFLQKIISHQVTFIQI